MYVGSLEREAMDLEDYGQEENDTALHLFTSRQHHKAKIIIEGVTVSALFWKFMVCTGHRR